MNMRGCQSALLLSHLIVAATSESLSVYPAVPGLQPSPYYKFRLQQVGSDQWLEPMAMLTECTDEKFCNTTGIGQKLDGWSNTYINFLMGDDTRVELEVTRLWGDEIIKTAVVHPAAAAEGCEVMDGKAYCVIHKQGLFTIDINGQMDEQDTGKLPDGGNYEGPAIHTLTVFANPFIEDVPSIFEEGVLGVSPGETAPTEGDWTTLVFLPGIHDIGVNFRLHSNRSYYIPGDAIVYGTMNNGQHGEDGDNIRIFGHGTLSGDLLPHPNFAQPPINESEHYTYHPINIRASTDCLIEGITISNSPSHTIGLSRPGGSDRPVEIRWIKIFTWRANGDGIGLKRNTLLEDSFIRTQDDSMYVQGRGVRRVVFWNDVNGVPFLLTKVGESSMEDHDIVVEDCTVVYSRRWLPPCFGGQAFNLRGGGGGDGGTRLTFRNIVVEDPRPTMQLFMLLLSNAGMDTCNGHLVSRDPGDVHGIVFQNISAAAPSVLGQQDTLWGMEEGHIYDLLFQNVRIGDKLVDSVEHFLTNQYVYDIKFAS